MKVLFNLCFTKTASTLFEDDSGALQATSKLNQLKVLLHRGVVKAQRDQTLTYLRIGVNVLTAIMLGTLYYNAGIDGTKVLDNYNLLFSILMHHTFSTMMLTILTCMFLRRSCIFYFFCYFCSSYRDEYFNQRAL